MRFFHTFFLRADLNALLSLSLSLSLFLSFDLDDRSRNVEESLLLSSTFSRYCLRQV